MGATHVPGKFLGDAASVELPPLGTSIAAGEPIGLITSSITVFEIVSPLSGTVADVNFSAQELPRRVTRDPYFDGWLLEIRPTDRKEMDCLLSARDYEKYFEEG